VVCYQYHGMKTDFYIGHVTVFVELLLLCFVMYIRVAACLECLRCFTFHSPSFNLKVFLISTP